MALLRELSRRVGRRPLAWFALFWAGATVLWLAFGVIHMRRDVVPDAPPVAAAVPYADFMPGGRRYSEKLALPIAPEDLPWYDRSLRLPRRYQYNQWLDGSQVRLACAFAASEGAYGWPRQWVRWSRYVVYDVTDPNEEFVPMTGETRPARNEWEPHQLTRTSYAENGAGYTVIVWQWSRMLVWALGVQAVAGLLALVLWFWNRAACRRRASLGLCLACGYDRRGTDAGASCPECGRTPPSGHDRRAPLKWWWRRPARLFLASWGALVLAWLIVVAASGTTTRARSIPGAIQGRLNVAIEVRRHRGPLPILWTIKGQSFAPEPDGRPEPTAHGIRNRTWAWRGTVNRIADTDDVSVVTTTTLFWTHALASIAGLQLLALAIVGAAAVVPVASGMLLRDRHG